MITESARKKIIEAIKINRRNYPTDTKHAVVLGISNSVYSMIKKGDTAGKLSPSNWITIARRLNVCLNDERPWEIVKTATFEYICTQLHLCQKCAISGMFCDIPNIGKTVAAKYYAQNTPDAVYIDCSQVKMKQQLVRAIAREFGVKDTGRYSDVYADLVFYIRQLPSALVILDEAGDLKYEAYLELKALWNATEHYCGWYQIGATALRAKIENGREKEKIGFDEIKSRYGDGYKRTTPEDAKQREAFLLEQALMVAKANVPEGVDYRQIARKSGNSLRRVYDLINKPETI